MRPPLIAHYNFTMPPRAAPWLLFVLVVLLAATGTAAAQDQGLDPLLFAPSPSAGQEGADVQATGVQLYRLPFSFRLRKADDERWGIRITFPVSLTSLRVRRVSDVGNFVKQLGVGSITPGIEFEIPLREGVRLRPFAEAGVGRDTDEGRTEVLYGAGTSVKVERPAGPARLTFGGAATLRKSDTSPDEYGAHATFEAGVDTQWPLGFSIQRKPAYAGVYVIARRYAGLELQREQQEPITLGRQFEAGVSFATRPVLRVWKLSLPWLGVGYQFGHTLSGVRIYTKFPF